MGVIGAIIGWYLVIALVKGIRFRYTKMEEDHNDFDIYRYAFSWPARLFKKFTSA